MKVITITENNIKEIYGRLNKFFHNNNATGFEEWHNVNCGFKRHISRDMYIDGRKILNMSAKFPAPDIRIDQKDLTIVVEFTALKSENIQIGDRIAFCGNHIILCTQETFFDEKKIFYTVYQALSMTQEAQEKMRRHDKAVMKGMWDEACKC